MYFPTASIIIATLNSARTLEQCLRSIQEQNYPQEKVEIILVDAGSTDKTLLIGEKYDCKIIIKRGVSSEAAKAYGLQKAKGEYIVDLASDNILPEKNWLKKIMVPFQEDKEIIASYPLHYTYRANDTIFNRYVALFGVNDPVPFYLGKADRQSYLYEGYALAGNVVAGLVPAKRRPRGSQLRKGGYYTVYFTPQNLPTVGANGFIIKKKILEKAQVSPEKYFHIDVVYDLVCQGYDKFAVVKTSIIHDTADTLFSLLGKRSRYFSSLYLEQLDKRRYHIVGKRDYSELFLFIFFSLTFIQPFLLSFRGYRKKKDPAWFIHPLFCFLITLIYAKEVLRSRIRKFFAASILKCLV